MGKRQILKQLGRLADSNDVFLINVVVSFRFDMKKIILIFIYFLYFQNFFEIKCDGQYQESVVDDGQIQYESLSLVRYSCPLCQTDVANLNDLKINILDLFKKICCCCCCDTPLFCRYRCPNSKCCRYVFFEEINLFRDPNS